MKRFVARLIYFLIMFILSIAFLLTIFSIYINASASFKVNDEIKYLILGHSHPECAYDDRLIDGLANFSQSGESYMYTYAKLKKLHEQNPQINVVFVEYTNNQIEPVMDSWVFGDDFLQTKYPKYFPFMSALDNFKLITHNFPGTVKSYSLFLRSVISQPSQKSYTGTIGGYLSLDRNKTESMLAQLSSNQPPTLEEGNLSDVNIEYLKKIIDFCHQKNIKLYLVRSPLHEKYPGRSNEKIYRDVLNRNFPGVELLDFENFPLSNSEFGDLEHLNASGAKRFSAWFNGLLKDGLLGQRNKQEFIDLKIDELKS